jgi:phenylalanine-4-hydroxylase
VTKIPFSMDCVDVNFDITKPQPQLFVAKDFATLTAALDELGKKMAFSVGGRAGLDKAKKAVATTTAEYDSGVQLSGVLTSFLLDRAGEPCYLQFTGPSQVSFRNQELPGQGARYHKEGYGSPVGRLKDGRSPAELGDFKGTRLEFESGVVVEGRVVDRVERDGRSLLLVFEDCMVKRGEQVLFQPFWGRYDMACGARVVSVFGHAADRANYLAATGGFHQEPGQQKTNLTDKNRALNDLYAKVRKLRETGAALGELTQVHVALEKNHREDWLLRYSLLELSAAQKISAPWEKAIRARLDEISGTSAEKAELIARGLELL